MILFFYGEETFNSSQKIIQLKKEFFKKNPTGGGLIIFDCDEKCDIYSIMQSFGEQNLFAQKKFIIIKNIFSNTKAPEQKELIEVIQNNDDVVIFHEEGKPRKNSALFKWLIKNADTIKETKSLKDYKLEQWIIKRVQKSDAKMTTEAVRELILFVGNDLWKLSTEIEKLICYANGKDISVEDVQVLVHGKVDADMFQMIEAVASNNKSLAITLLNKQITAGDEPFHIFGMFAYQVRTLLGVGSMMEENIRDNNVIARELKLHPFVAQKTIGMIDSLSYSTVLLMHKKLTELDYDIKVGKRDIETAMNIFIMKT